MGPTILMSTMERVQKDPIVLVCKEHISKAGCPKHWISVKGNTYKLDLTEFELDERHTKQLVALIRKLNPVHLVEYDSKGATAYLRRGSKIHQHDMLNSIAECLKAILWNEYVRVGSALAYSADNR